jgi:hypothetical protein
MEHFGFWASALEWFRASASIVQIMVILVLETLLLGILTIAAVLLRQRWERIHIRYRPDDADLVYAVYRTRDKTYDAYWYEEMSLDDDDTTIRHHDPAKTKAMARL